MKAITNLDSADYADWNRPNRVWPIHRRFLPSPFPPQGEGSIMWVALAEVYASKVICADNSYFLLLQGAEIFAHYPPFIFVRNGYGMVYPIEAEYRDPSERRGLDARWYLAKMPR